LSENLTLGIRTGVHFHGKHVFSDDWITKGKLGRIGGRERGMEPWSVGVKE
jgi:hypothetical protein